MQESICLSTDELYPITPGGCGTLIYNTVYELLRAKQPTIVLTSISSDKLDWFKTNCIDHFPNKQLLELISLDDFAKAEVPAVGSAFDITHLALSKRYCNALLDLLSSGSMIKMVEFPDFWGLAYYSLLERMSGSPLRGVEISVRVHSTMEWVHLATPLNLPAVEDLQVYGVERWCIRNADRILLPSEALADLFVEHYGSFSNLEVSAPSLAAMELSHRQAPENDSFEIVFYGRLAPSKGVDIFVGAAVELLKNTRGAPESVSFTVAGPDIYVLSGNMKMREYLEAMIPEEYLDRFRFTGNLDRLGLQELVQSAGAAVFPTRHETFCYAARELRVSGVPVVVSDIPAFRDLIDSGLALPCSLSVDSVAESMERLFTDKALRQRMSRQRETTTNLLDAYAHNNRNKVSVVQQKVLGSITVLVMCPQSASTDLVETTVKSVGNGEKYASSIQLVCFSEDLTGDYIFSGKRWSADKEPSAPAEYFACLFAGDVLGIDFFRRAAEIFSGNDSIGVISANRVNNGVTDNFLWNLSPELRPDDALGPLRALILNTGQSWNNFFDHAYSSLGEVAAIYSVLDGGHSWVHLDDVTCDIVSVPRERSEVVIAKKKLMQEFGLSVVLSLRLAADLVYFDRSDISQGSIHQAMKSGQVPRVMGVRLNLRNLLNLIYIRVRYLVGARLSKSLGSRAPK